MARRTTRSAGPPIVHNPPLEERVDKAGKRLLAKRNAKRDAAAVKPSRGRLGARKP